MHKKKIDIFFCLILNLIIIKKFLQFQEEKADNMASFEGNRNFKPKNNKNVRKNSSCCVECRKAETSGFWYPEFCKCMTPEQIARKEEEWMLEAMQMSGLKKCTCNKPKAELEEHVDVKLPDGLKPHCSICEKNGKECKHCSTVISYEFGTVWVKNPDEHWIKIKTLCPILNNIVKVNSKYTKKKIWYGCECCVNSKNAYIQSKYNYFPHLKTHCPYDPQHKHINVMGYITCSKCNGCL